MDIETDPNNYLPSSPSLSLSTPKPTLTITDNLYFRKNRLSQLNNYQFVLVGDMTELFRDYMFSPSEMAMLQEFDVSQVTSMMGMFHNSNFNGDISGWSTSNVTDMRSMFASSWFNGDISAWSTGRVTNMTYMFALSRFNRDISGWSTNNVVNMSGMFSCSKFNRDISGWSTHNVVNMCGIFVASRFNQDITSWNLAALKHYNNIFCGSPLDSKYRIVQNYTTLRKVASPNGSAMSCLICQQDFDELIDNGQCKHYICETCFSQYSRQCAYCRIGLNKGYQIIPILPANRQPTLK